MSQSLLTLSALTSLIQSLGLKTREGLSFSMDGECLYVQAKIDVISSTEVDTPSSSGRSVKKTLIPKEVLLTPVLDMNFQLVSRAAIRRIVLSPNPELFKLGGLQYPTVLEPLTDDKIFCYVNCKEGVKLEDFDGLTHFMRLYILT